MSKVMSHINHARPFPGMRPFDISEFELFHGQETQIDAVLDRLGRSRFIVVMGESGCGKSSLIKAGLIPRLFGGRVDSRDQRWRVVVCQPGMSPISNLAEGLSAKLNTGSREGTEQMLRSSSHGLVEAVSAVKLQRGHRVLILVDQFEELFRFQRESRTGDENAVDEAALFVKLLLGVPEAASSFQADATPIYVVLTMRSEYVGDCASFFRLGEAINQGAYLLPKMTRASLELAIRGPLEQFNATIDNDLLQTLLNEVLMAQQDGLPLLQHALRRIWEKAENQAGATRLSMVHLQALPKDVKGNLLLERQLNAHLDETLEEKIADMDRRIVQRIFCQLGEYDHKGRLIRRSIEFRTLMKVVGLESKKLLALIDVFRDEEHGRSFLMPSKRDDDDLVRGRKPLDISHEALLRRWFTLRDWIATEAKDAEFFRGLADRARNKKSSSLRGSELVQALAWRKAFKPTVEWSIRYLRGHYQDDDAGAIHAATMVYLNRSRNYGVARLVTAISLIILAIVTPFIYFNNRVTAEKTEFQRQLQAQKNAQEAAALKDRNALLTEKNTQLETQAGELKESQTALKAALSASSKAFEREKDARNLQEKETKKAQDAEGLANQRLGDVNTLNQQLKSERNNLSIANESLQKNESELKNLNNQLLITAERREADFIFRGLQRLASDPNESQNTLARLMSAADSYLTTYNELPDRVMAALNDAVNISYMSATDSRKDDPVLLARPGKLGVIDVIRRGIAAADLEFKVPRLVWSVETGSGTDSITAVGGAGGYVRLSNDKQQKVRKVDPFAVTGLGFSTDGEWVATASSSSDMRVLRTKEFLEGNLWKDRVLQFGNATKLFAFLAVHSYKGEFPVREFALIVAPHTNRRSEKNDLTIYGLTESGRLIRWSTPGPFGKQLGVLDKLSVGVADPATKELKRDVVFSAVATNPATQEVWAAKGSEFGKVSGYTFSQVQDVGVRTGIAELEWNARGDLFAIGLRDGTIQIYETGSPTLRQIVALPAHSATVTTLSWHGDVLASGSIDGVARLWNLNLSATDRSMLRQLAEFARRDNRQYIEQKARNPKSEYEEVAGWIRARVESFNQRTVH